MGETARSRWLAWRPRTRFILLWNRGIKRLYSVLGANQQWFNARAVGARAFVLIPVFFFVQFWIIIVGVAVVGEITIFPLAASIYAVFFEWLALLLLSPFVFVVRSIRSVSNRATGPELARR